MATWAVVALTTAQLLVATLFPDLPQFDGKAFGSRLVAYPLMMSAPVVAWWLAARRRQDSDPLPWLGFTLIGIPFLVDVTGNTLDLYDSVAWWDDANHLVNWAFLCGGIGLLLLRSPRVSADWVLVLAVTGSEVLALQLTSIDHDRDAAQEAGEGRYWMDVGTGAWDSQRRPSEVRLDRLLRLDPVAVRREGAALPRPVFDAVVAAATPYLAEPQS